MPYPDWAQSDLVEIAERPDARLTICIPAYRAAGFLMRTLNAVRRQGFREFRVLVSNDGGHDADAIAAMCTDPGIELVQQETRLGWVGNANWLISRVRTPFFAILPHDDEPAPDYYGAMIRMLEANPQAATAICNLGLAGLADAPQGGLAARAHLGPRQTRILNILLHDYPGISMRGVNRTPRDLNDLALHPNAHGDLFVDSTWIMQQAVLGEIVAVPKVLFVKHFHDRNTHTEWPRQTKDVIARAWLTHCVHLAAIGLKHCPTQQGREDILAAATRRCLNPRRVGVPPWIIDACAKIWRSEAALAVEAGFCDRVAERLADLGRPRPDHHGREASNDR